MAQRKRATVRSVMAAADELVEEATTYGMCKPHKMPMARAALLREVILLSRQPKKARRR